MGALYKTVIDNHPPSPRKEGVGTSMIQQTTLCARTLQSAVRRTLCFPQEDYCGCAFQESSEFGMQKNEDHLLPFRHPNNADVGLFYGITDSSKPVPMAY